jgi:hypothetical protein
MGSMGWYGQLLDDRGVWLFDVDTDILSLLSIRSAIVLIT